MGSHHVRPLVVGSRFLLPLNNTPRLRFFDNTGLKRCFETGSVRHLATDEPDDEKGKKGQNRSSAKFILNCLRREVADNISDEWDGANGDERKEGGESRLPRGGMLARLMFCLVLVRFF